MVSHTLTICPFHSGTGKDDPLVLELPRESGDALICLGSLFSVTCAHNNTDDRQTRWEVSNNSQLAFYSLADHDDKEGYPSNFSQYSFLEGGISDTSGPTLTSTVVATAIESLNGTVLVCRAGGWRSHPEAGNVTVHVVGTSVL